MTTKPKFKNLKALILGALLTIIIVSSLTGVSYFIGYPFGKSFAKAALNLDLYQPVGGSAELNGKFWWSDPDATSMFPFSIQTFLYFAFSLALILLFYRWKKANEEIEAINFKPLPDDDQVLIQPADVGDYLDRISAIQDSLIGKMSRRALLQYQSTSSTSETAAIVNAQADVARHNIESDYSLINYLAWAIPSLGFTGTVLGIGRALVIFGDSNLENLQMSAITANLGSAFYTTLVALIISLILMYIVHNVQAKEESIVADVQEYCISNLVNRLYDPRELTS